MAVWDWENPSRIQPPSIDPNRSRLYSHLALKRRGEKFSDRKVIFFSDRMNRYVCVCVCPRAFVCLCVYELRVLVRWCGLSEYAWVFVACRFAPIVTMLSQGRQTLDPKRIRANTRKDLSPITHDAAEGEVKKDAAYVLQPHLRVRFRANGGFVVQQVALPPILEALTGADVHSWNRKATGKNSKHPNGLHLERIEQLQVPWYLCQ